MRLLSALQRALSLPRLGRTVRQTVSGTRPTRFPAEDGQSSTNKGWADTFEAIAKILGLPLVHENGARAYTGHSARVSGARFMASHDIELWRVQLFGRWGSQVFLHYIQDAPLAQLDTLALNQRQQCRSTKLGRNLNSCDNALRLAKQPSCPRSWTCSKTVQPQYI